MNKKVIMGIGLVIILVFGLYFGGFFTYAMYGGKCFGSISSMQITEEEITYKIVKNPIDVCRYQNPGSVGLCLNVADVHRIVHWISKEKCEQYVEWWPGTQISWQDDPPECRIHSLPTKTDEIEIIGDILVSGSIDAMYHGNEGSCTVGEVNVTGMTGNSFVTSKLICIRGPFKGQPEKDVAGALAIVYSVSGTVTLKKVEPEYWELDTETLECELKTSEKECLISPWCNYFLSKESCENYATGKWYKNPLGYCYPLGKDMDEEEYKPFYTSAGCTRLIEEECVTDEECIEFCFGRCSNGICIYAEYRPKKPCDEAIWLKPPDCKWDTSECISAVCEDFGYYTMALPDMRNWQQKEIDGLTCWYVEEEEKTVCCKIYGYGVNMEIVNVNYEWKKESECIVPPDFVGGGKDIVSDAYCIGEKQKSICEIVEEITGWNCYVVFGTIGSSVGFVVFLIVLILLRRRKR